MADVIIPLTSDPDQYFSCTLPIDNKNLTLSFRIRYNTIAGYWVMAIADSNNVVLIDSIPLIRGAYPAGDILKQYRHLNIGRAYIVKNGKVDMDYPNDTNLGTDFLLVWSDTNG